MAGPVPTYEYYSKEFGGSLSQDDFQAVISKAVARVNARCCLFDLFDLPDKELTAYQNACCIACDALTDPAVSSYTASKVSETYVDAPTMGIDDLIEQCLSGTYLIETAL
jgi:hypothetical protein